MDIKERKMTLLKLINISRLSMFCLGVLLLTSLNSEATILSVALDGSQDYTVIQAAINATAHGDTVLVYPGRYYENVTFNGRNITLASLELITGNREYVYSTIIDGNQNGSVIKSSSYESNISIRGFTITNGTGDLNVAYDITLGGGIALYNMTGQRTAVITNCLITGNRATNGGGFWGGACNLTLSGVTIRHNNASSGGGIYFNGSETYNYNTTYDYVNRCSIYSNFAATGSDMYYSNLNSIQVIVDTFTVANPWNFYATAIPRSPNIVNPFIFDIIYTVHEEVNHDIYVAPWGDDNNNGLSPAEPMRSIFMAMYRIASDSENPKTVHVANGTYSSSLNGQQYPVPVKRDTRLKGESLEGTVLDAEFQEALINLSAYSHNMQISTITIQNGTAGVYCNYADSYLIDDVIIRNLQDVRSSGGLIDYGSKGILSVENMAIENVIGPSVNGIQFGFSSGQITLKNVAVSSCVSSSGLIVLNITTRNENDILIDGLNVYESFNSSPDVFSGNTLLQIAPYDNYGTRLRIDIKNSAFYDNYQALPAQMGMVRSLNDTLFISNCTFAGNSGGSSTLAVQGTSVLTNNIFHNPAMSTQILIPNYISSGINSHTTLRHNNILGGASGVYNSTPANPLIWGEGNTDHDPMFSMQGNRPYTLSNLSPLIDSGWQPALAEPGYDAGGNERLWDGDGDGIAVIDKGAYEYQPIWSPINLSAELWNSQVLLSWEMPDPPRGLSGYRVYCNHQPHADLDGADHSWFRERITVADTLVYQVAALYGNVESALSDSVVVIVSNVQSSDELAPMLPTLNVGPNPFTDLAVIRYTPPKAAKVELSIYNLRGQKVRSLEGEHRSAGEHVQAWEGCDDRAQDLASGVYLLRLSLDGKATRQMKVVLVK